MTGTEPEYLTPETLNEYFAAGTPTRQPMGSNPRCWLRIDPEHETFTLYAPFVGEMPDVATYERLDVNTVDLDDGTYFELDVEAAGLRHEGYSLIASIVDAMRAGDSFASATHAAVVSFRDLLAGRQRLTREKEQGLIGELLVLRHLVGRIGSRDALTAWLGPQSAEHDFAFPTFDIEVKTTTSEKRSHMIGSVTQLMATPGRPLWLMSIQITRAGASLSSFSLSGLVDELRTAINEGRQDFLTYLGSVGWRDQDQDLYLTRHMYRSLPAAYLVDETFPAVTRPRLDSVVPHPDLVGAISYRVDVSSLDKAIPPGPLDQFVVEHKGSK